MEFIYWDHSYNSVLIANFIIVIMLFTSLRMFSGTLAHVNASDELLKKDNPAFGISLASVVFAIAILLSSSIYGRPEDELTLSAISTAVYGIIGISLMAIARIVFDKIALPDISLRDEITKGNIAVAIADSGNVIASAVILRALIIWVPNASLSSLGAIIVAYATSQAILTSMTLIRIKRFGFKNKNKSIQAELINGNTSMALSFAGQKIGTAFAISIAANLVVYETYDIQNFLLPWVIVSMVVIALLKVLSFIAERIVLFKVDIAHEILEQKNIAVGFLRAMIYVSLAFLLAEI